ncbi:MAG: hypothetical protein WD972_01000 [Candidatus Andersenbacteria bacterium]
MDATSWFVAWQRHKGRLGTIIVGLLLFIVGWQAGRVTSPYYAAHQIVFNDAEPSGGSPEELLALQQEGVAMRAGTVAAATVLPTGQAGSPTVAGAVSTPTPASEAAVEASGTTEKLYVASKNSNLYHHKDCPSVSRIKEENKVWFTTPEAAEAAGLSPSQCTEEKLGI